MRCADGRVRGWPIALIATCVLLAFSDAAFAAPDITLSKSTPGQVLYGTDATVTLTASNPAVQPFGYNLSFRDVLPPGVHYVAGSAPSAPRVIADAPTAGSTTLVWVNLVDLAPGTSQSLSYSVSHDTAVFDVGDTYSDHGYAYVNTDPHTVPAFTLMGEPDPTTITGSADAVASSTLVAVEVEKDEPSPEGELLRGAHDHQTVYSVTLRNNQVAATSG